MAIRTTHFALLDLRKQLVATASCPENSDGLELIHPIFMVEFEDKRVALAAIDAGMRPKIVIDLAKQIYAAGSLASPVGGRVLRLVSSVVLPGIYAHAKPTANSSQSASSVTVREVLESSCLAAAGAPAERYFL
jgi:hypothetical protein